MGPPGAGKGTQARFIAEVFGIPAISTGDIFRANVFGGTELGREAKRYMDAGEYVPDEVTNDMVRSRLSQDDAAPGFLLDGYPRTLSQVNELDAMVGSLGHFITAVVCLTVDEDEIVARLLQRAQLEGRTDDTEIVIRRRQEIYVEQTEPLIDVYRSRGLIRQIDGLGEVADVSHRILAILDHAPADHGRATIRASGATHLPVVEQVPQECGRDHVSPAARRGRRLDVGPSELHRGQQPE